MFCSETGLVRSAHTFRSGFGFGGPTLAARSAAAVGMLGCWDVGIGGYARALMHCTYGGNLYNQPGPTVEKTRCEGRGAQNAKAHSATAGGILYSLSLMLVMLNNTQIWVHIIFKDTV